jgi:hypothetical protein
MPSWIDEVPEAHAVHNVTGCPSVDGQPASSVTRSLAMGLEATSEAIAQARIGNPNRFPGPLFVCRRRIRPRLAG